VLTINQIRLLLAATMFVSLLLALTLTFDPGASDVSAKTQEQERHLEILIPKHVPLGIKIRKEKEKEFKDLNNEKWARDFELEVTNTGDKPIYSFDFLLKLDVTAAAGYQIIAPLSYGRDELSDHRVRAKPEDDALEPGESVILKIHPSQIEWWERARREEHRAHPTKVEIKFQNLSFGDGTGLMGDAGVAVPRKIPPQSNLRRSGPPRDKSWRNVLQWAG